MYRRTRDKSHASRNMRRTPPSFVRAYETRQEFSSFDEQGRSPKFKFPVAGARQSLSDLEPISQGKLKRSGRTDCGCPAEEWRRDHADHHAGIHGIQRVEYVEIQLEIVDLIAFARFGIGGRRTRSAKDRRESEVDLLKAGA